MSVIIYGKKAAYNFVDFRMKRAGCSNSRRASFRKAQNEDVKRKKALQTLDKIGRYVEVS